MYTNNVLNAVCMCRDPGDTKSKVSCCVKPFGVFKIAILMQAILMPHALPLKMSLSQKQNKKNKTGINHVLILWTLKID